MTAAASWFVAGLVLAALEMAAPGVFLLWIGFAALATGAVTLFGIGWHAQVAVFVAFALVSIAYAWRRLKRRPSIDTVNAPAVGLVGQMCRAVLFQDGEGRVALGDGQWSARVTDASAPEPGQAMRVVGLDGTVLLVARAA